MLCIFIFVYELRLRMKISNKAASPAFAATLPASEDLVKVLEHPSVEAKVAVSPLLVSVPLTVAPPTVKERVTELPEGIAVDSEKGWLLS